ncbi:hypothetical protein FRC15_004012 [Serendipita sp. 397]|nr:hypothetical protein FRC15_004012 [Serendipita sp. 397]
MANMGNMSATSPNFSNPHGSLSPGGSVGGSASSSFAMRRMSEPSSAAPRMIMRRLPPPTGHPQTAIAAAGNPPI